MENNDIAIKIGKKTFITAIIILGILMIVAGVLTYVVPGGSYDRETIDGREMVVDGSFVEGESQGFPVYRWITAPFEVLASDDGPMVIVIIFFLLVIASAIALLDKSGIISAFIAKIVKRFKRRKYLLLAVIVFFFMLMGATLGTFEENIALVPIIIALAYCFKWDSLVGLGMSILASCFGFTAAITNPFSIAITQEIAELPMYSGTGYRIIIFLSYYALLMVFLLRYAKKIEKDPTKSLVFKEDQKIREKYSSAEQIEEALGKRSEKEQKQMGKASKVFGYFIIIILVMVVISPFISILSDLLLPLIGVVFLIGSIIAASIAKLEKKEAFKATKEAILGIAPGIILILMAMSVKFIISQGGIMDSILYHASNSISGTSPYIAIILVYVLILVLELFVGSSSAKAFLIMPLISPLADLVGITRQSAVLAFSFGDGFSNVIYPTNPVLLICLGLTIVSYPKWFKWTYKLQAMALLLGCVFLIIAVATNYGPF